VRVHRQHWFVATGWMIRYSQPTTICQNMIIAHPTRLKVPSQHKLNKTKVWLSSEHMLHIWTVQYQLLAGKSPLWPLNKLIKVGKISITDYVSVKTSLNFCVSISSVLLSCHKVLLMLHRKFSKRRNSQSFLKMTFARTASLLGHLFLRAFLPEFDRLTGCHFAQLKGVRWRVSVDLRRVQKRRYLIHLLSWT